MSSQALKDIAEISFDDPKYQEASRHELAMKLLAADNDIKGLNDKLEALTKQLESSTKKAIKFKTKYHNSQCAVGDIFESLKKVIVNFTDQKRTFCTSKLHTFFVALTEELDQPSKDSINSYGANVELLETLCTKAERKRQVMMCKICKEPKKGHKCPYKGFEVYDKNHPCHCLEDFKVKMPTTWDSMNSACREFAAKKIEVRKKQAEQAEPLLNLQHPRKKARSE